MGNQNFDKSNIHNEYIYYGDKSSVYKYLAIFSFITMIFVIVVILYYIFDIYGLYLGIPLKMDIIPLLTIISVFLIGTITVLFLWRVSSFLLNKHYILNNYSNNFLDDRTSNNISAGNWVIENLSNNYDIYAIPNNNKLIHEEIYRISEKNNIHLNVLKSTEEDIINEQ